MLDLKILLNQVFRAEKLGDEHVAGVINAIYDFKKGRYR
jgi:hypothetical protein